MTLYLHRQALSGDIDILDSVHESLLQEHDIRFLSKGSCCSGAMMSSLSSLLNGLFHI